MTTPWTANSQNDDPAPRQDPGLPQGATPDAGRSAGAARSGGATAVPRRSATDDGGVNSPADDAAAPVSSEQAPGSRTGAAETQTAPQTVLHRDLGTVIGRIPITKVSPVIEGGAYAAKAAVGEDLPFRATVFREGHDAVAAAVVLTSPSGQQRSLEMVPCEPKGWNRMEARARLEEAGPWTFRIEAFDDPWATWVHHAEIKLPAGIDTGLVCAEGQLLVDQAVEAARTAGDQYAVGRLQALTPLFNSHVTVSDRAEQLLPREVRTLMQRYRPRRLVTTSADFPVFCDRRRALYSSWYEFFPRSQGARQDRTTGEWASGTFDSSHERLEAAAAMGFDVIYLPPIHPIGSAFRKGPNNTLTPAPGDPGSPWAIGGTEGGHDALHPDLGDWDAFDRFVARAGELGMEVALDFALQASPDHPWVTEHPEWFSERADGTIAYAENPPKKYQDIYPINFDRDRAGIYAESLRLLRFWAAKGVRIFRVDNPHTKPVEFWAWIIEQFRRTDPDVIFLAEAFTKPEMMHMLGKVGFQQSYTYFTWRNERWELEEYLAELTGGMEEFYRPNFFVNTPDINPTFLQHSGPSGFTIRAVLAATMSASWGVYSGFEVFESAPVKPGGEEYLNSEKYQYRPRDFSGGAHGNLSQLLTILNRLRADHRALQQQRQITFHHCPNPNIIVYSRTDGLKAAGQDAAGQDTAGQDTAGQDTAGQDTAGQDTVLVVCSLNPHHAEESEIYLKTDELGLDPGAVLAVHDHLTDADFEWGARNYVRLTPQDPAHVLTLRSQ